jgi:hypothetical protein
VCVRQTHSWDGFTQSCQGRRHVKTTNPKRKKKKENKTKQMRTC